MKQSTAITPDSGLSKGPRRAGNPYREHILGSQACNGRFALGERLIHSVYAGANGDRFSFQFHPNYISSLDF